MSEPAEVVTEAGSFDTHGVLDALEDAQGARVPLGGGADMYVEPTRALVAVDVNTGNDTSPAAGLKASLAAVRELPRQLRLRGLGGIVVIDLAPFPKRERHVVEQVLSKTLRADAGEANLAGWTPLGNIELTRKRDRLLLSDWMQA